MAEMLQVSRQAVSKWEAGTGYPETDKIVIATFDGSQTVDCLSVRYDKILFHSKNEPAYILMAVDRVGFFGAHTVILGWYDKTNLNELENFDLVNDNKS